MRSKQNRPANSKEAPIRYFVVEDEMVKGSTGQEDTEEFADELTQLQMYAQALGAKLEMTMISHGAIAENGKTMAFRFEDGPENESNPLHGLLVNRRFSYSEAMDLLKQD